MSDLAAARLRSVVLALSPLRIIFVALREWFAPSGPGRKITLAVIFAETYLRAIPLITMNTEAVVVATYGLVLVFGGSALAQGLIGDKLKSAGKAPPSDEPPAGGAP